MSATLGIRATMAEVVAMTREISSIRDPQELVRVYASRVRRISPTDATISVSRRGLTYPAFRVTRDTRWPEAVNPWKEPGRLVTYAGGIIAEWLYGNEPVIAQNLEIPEGDPARAILGGFGSALAIPQFDGGEALNMVISLKNEPGGIDEAQAPFMVWMANLFGRATGNLVLAERLREANEVIERELRVVADLQRSLLPAQMPLVEGVQFADYYEPSRYAGGDYYDVLPLGGGRLGLLIADVSGHGTPAAVMMAMTQTLTHASPGRQDDPAGMLGYLNEQLTGAYERTGAGFVTAFYGVLDPTTGRLTYSSAGHNPPRLRTHDARVVALDEARDLPLGIDPSTRFENSTLSLGRGDSVVLYTDGITEAKNPQGHLFGEDRLDDVIARRGGVPSDAVPGVLGALSSFTAGHPADDDRTLLAFTLTPTTPTTPTPPPPTTTTPAT